MMRQLEDMGMLPIEAASEPEIAEEVGTQQVATQHPATVKRQRQHMGWMRLTTRAERRRARRKQEQRKAKGAKRG